MSQAHVECDALEFKQEHLRPTLLKGKWIEQKGQVRMRKLVLAISSLAVAGCARSEFHRTLGESVVRQDLVIMKTIVQDLVQWEEFETYRSWRNRPEIVVWSLTLGESPFLSRSQMELEDLGMPEWAYVALVKRNVRQEPLEGLRGSLPGVIVAPEITPLPGMMDVEFEARHPKARAFIGFWLPAYNHEQSEAVVRLEFGPTAHLRLATYILVLDGVNWKVARKMVSKFA